MAKSKRCFDTSPEGSNWMARQWKAVPKRRGARSKCPCTDVGLDHTDRQSDAFVWSQWRWSKKCGKQGVKINRLFFMWSLIGQQQILNRTLYVLVANEGNVGYYQWINKCPEGGATHPPWLVVTPQWIPGNANVSRLTPTTLSSMNQCFTAGM